MGVKQGSSDSVQYVRVKEGKLYLKGDETPYDELEGKIVGLNLKIEDYEGQQIEKLEVTMNDGEKNYRFGISLDSSYCGNFIGFLKTANLNESLSVVPRFSIEKDKTGKDVKRRGILVKQNGTFLKSAFGKDTELGQELPKMKEVKISGKTMWDKTDYLEYFRGVIAKMAASFPKNEAKPTVAHVDDEDNGSNLPF